MKYFQNTHTKYLTDLARKNGLTEQNIFKKMLNKSKKNSNKENYKENQLFKF